MHTIGTAAKRTELPAKTIRYYADIGLVTPKAALKKAIVSMTTAPYAASSLCVVRVLLAFRLKPVAPCLRFTLINPDLHPT